MNFDDLALGWREALLGAVVLLVLYVAIVFSRLRRLRQTPARNPQAVQAAPPAAANPDSATGQNAAAELVAAAYNAPADPDFPWNEPPDAPSGEERLASLEGEVTSLRTELESVRGELSSLSGEIDRLRADFRQELGRMNDQVQAAQHVAPIYGDAMQLALAGHDAASIAERCGVARAEAELVVSLIRNRDGKPAEDADQLRMRER
jgi:hypothetical protein